MMDSRQLVSLGVAVLCMTTIGVSATTLGSTISTNPDDAINVNFDTLPIGHDSAANIDKAVNSDKRNTSQNVKEQPSGSRDPTRSDTNSHRQQRDRQHKAITGGTSDQQTQASAPSQAQASSGGGSRVQRLMDLLTKLLPYVLAALAFLLLVGVLYRYRDRLAALLLLALDRVGLSSTDGHDVTTTPWDTVQLDDDVERSWYEMVTSVGIDRPWARTPAECRERALQAGLEPDAVRTLTETFREARYANRGPTERHERRARACLDRLDLGGTAP